MLQRQVTRAALAASRPLPRPPDHHWAGKKPPTLTSRRRLPTVRAPGCKPRAAKRSDCQRLQNVQTANGACPWLQAAGCKRAAHGCKPRAAKSCLAKDKDRAVKTSSSHCEHPHWLHGPPRWIPLANPANEQATDLKAHGEPTRPPSPLPCWCAAPTTPQGGGPLGESRPFGRRCN